jgi:hypothetical protein
MGVTGGTSEATGRLWRPPLWLGFVWGIAEATLFFIIPDVIITWTALIDARRGIRMLAAAAAGALVGGSLLYASATFDPEGSRAAVDAVPFVGAGMFQRVTEAYAGRGPTAMLYAPGNGIPYKVYAVLAPPVMDFGTFAAMTVPARLVRFLAGWVVFTGLGLLFANVIRRHPTPAKLLFGIAWTAGYAIYWSLI